MRAGDNPFAVHRVLRERYRLDEAGWSALFDRLARARWRGAIVGPHGSGKTTLLEDLAERLAQHGWCEQWLRLDSSDRRLPRTGRWTSRDFVLVDGAEQLAAFDAARLAWRARLAGGFVVTAHDSRRWGPVLYRCQTSPALLADLVGSLGQHLSATESEALHRRHRGNLRDAIRALYDRAALSSLDG